MNQNKICNFLIQLRKEKKLSQEELADKINISRQAVSKWEQGKCIPDKSNFGVLSEIFQVSVAELLAGERLEKEEDDEILLDLHEERQKEIKKNKKLSIVIFVLAIIIVIFLFLIYYFVVNFNKISVYTISTSKDDVSLTEGLLVKTNDKVYFRLGEIASSKKIKDMRLYYLTEDNQENLIYACENCSNLDISFTDSYGYNEYIDFDNIDKVIKNMKLDLGYEDESITIDLDFKKDFSNNKLFYQKSPSITSPIGENKPYPTNPLKAQLQAVFEKNQDGYIKNIKIGSNKVSAVILDDALSIYIDNKEYREYWGFGFLDNILIYKRSKDGKTLED
ncbi:MAG: helix-turn-helix domain-containing protein, partial [Bacilli bacterium]|nr:helix-turn-helix domain-containing protein [Bacilli bacterium]